MMKKVIIAAFSILLLFILATIAVSYMRSYLAADRVAGSTISIQESIKRGTFCCKFSVEPSSLRMGGKTVAIENAWVEHKCKIEWPWVWFPTWKIVDGYYLVIKIDQYLSPGGIAFRIDGQRQSFGLTSVGGEYVLFYSLDDESSSSFTIIVTNETDSSQPDQTIVLTRIE